MVVEGDGGRSSAASAALPFLVDDHSFAINQEVVNPVEDAVCSHLSLESVVPVVDFPQQLLFLAAGQRWDLGRVVDLWSGEATA